MHKRNCERPEGIGARIRWACPAGCWLLVAGVIMSDLLSGRGLQAESPEPEPSHEVKATWLVLDNNGPRDESGPPVVLYVTEEALREATNCVGHDTPYKALISAGEMEQVTSYFVRNKLWNTPLAKGESIATRPFQFTFGGVGAPVITNLDPNAAGHVLLALKTEVLKDATAIRFVSDFSSLYGWK
jgi:hypothetical protein